MDGNGGRLSIDQALMAWQKRLPSAVTELVVGYSGGRDSHVLLHALCQHQWLRTRYAIRAVYVNHGLRPDAARWGEHCQAICNTLAVPLTIESLALKLEQGQSVEEIARLARYSALKATIKPHQALLTAHHQNDQAETVMLQLLRGSGPKGLAAMPLLKSFGLGWHARPLLKVPREFINDYAKDHALVWIEDDSNSDLRFTRNYLRHKMSAILSDINPSYADCFARTAQHCAEQIQLLESYVAQDIAHCHTVSGGLLLSALRNFPTLRQQAIVRLWLQNQGYPLPSTKKLQEIVQQMIHARLDAHPCVEWGAWQVQRVKGEMVVAARKVWTVS